MTQPPNSRTLASFDWFIKKLLRDKVNFDILEGFLSTLLEQDLVVEELLESQTNAEQEDSKQIVVDLLCKTTRGALVLIEVQYHPEAHYFHRLAYYMAKVLSERLKRSEGYGSINKIYSVHLVYFDLGVGEDYAYRAATEFRGMNKNDLLSATSFQTAQFSIEQPGEIFPEHIILKVGAFSGEIHKPLDEWLYYFKNSRLPDNYQAKGLSLVAQKLNFENMNVEDIKAYREAKDRDMVPKQFWIDAYKMGEFEGKSEGKAEGKAEGKVETILRAYQLNLPVAQIALLVALDPTEVEQILKQHGLP